MLRFCLCSDWFRVVLFLSWSSRVTEWPFLIMVSCENTCSWQMPNPLKVLSQLLGVRVLFSFYLNEAPFWLVQVTPSEISSPVCSVIASSSSIWILKLTRASQSHNCNYSMNIKLNLIKIKKWKDGQLNCEGK